MSNFVDLKIPQAWKPLLKAIADAGWEFSQSIDQRPDWECLLILEFEQAGETCYLYMWEEGEWCGNNFQGRALTVAGFAATFPIEQAVVETHSLLLTGNWVEEVDEFVDAFLNKIASKMGDNGVIYSELHT